MTYPELQTLINETIVPNGANEITADVLRPVLLAMAAQINTLVGNEADLPDGASSVINAINNLPTSGITIHTGTANPNTTPPSGFSLGDFYNQTASDITIAFWQYNGITWVEVLSRREQKLRNVASALTSYAVQPDDDLVIYAGANVSDVITLPDVELYKYKVLVLANPTAFNISTSTYQDVDGTPSTDLDAGTVLQLQSNGLDWIRINNP